MLDVDLNGEQLVQNDLMDPDADNPLDLDTENDTNQRTGEDVQVIYFIIANKNMINFRTLPIHNRPIQRLNLQQFIVKIFLRDRYTNIDLLYVAVYWLFTGCGLFYG